MACQFDSFQWHCNHTPNIIIFVQGITPKISFSGPRSYHCRQIRLFCILYFFYLVQKKSLHMDSDILNNLIMGQRIKYHESCWQVKYTPYVMKRRITFSDGIGFCRMLTLWSRVMHITIYRRLTIIGSDTGLSPGRQKAIIWTNAGILLIGAWEQTSVKSSSKFIHFHSMKCMWKGRLEYSGHFVSAWMC